MITLAVAAVLAALALPDFSRFIARNRIASQADSFVADLNYARASAIRRQEDITVCPSSNGTTCNNALSWDAGWIITGTVNNQPSVVLRVGAPLSNSTVRPSATTGNLTAPPFPAPGFPDVALPLYYHSDGTFSGPQNTLTAAGGAPSAFANYEFCGATSTPASSVASNNNGVAVYIDRMGAPQASAQQQPCP